jgi:predicted PurR-regulated permease PerM
LVWRAYYLIKKDNYLKISTLLICIFSVFAIILNVEGSNCITKINSSLLISNSSNEEGNVNNNDFRNQGAQVQQQPQQQQQQDVDTQSQEALMQQSYELRKYCFLVTNLYVYSLFGIIIGFIILVLWFMRYKKIWSWKKADPTN